MVEEKMEEKVEEKVEEKKVGKLKWACEEFGGRWVCLGVGILGVIFVFPAIGLFGPIAVSFFQR